MNRKLQLALLVVISLTISACTPKPIQTVTDDPVPTARAADEKMWGTAYNRDELLSVGIDRNPLEYKTVHFAYNSTAFTEKSTIIVKAHARELASRNGAQVSLAGHADERGTRDFNLALGERRSQAVAGLMNATGAGGSTINSISYGEERPVDSSHNEAAWHANRRVEISY